MAGPRLNELPTDVIHVIADELDYLSVFYLTRTSRFFSTHLNKMSVSTTEAYRKDINAILRVLSCLKHGRDIQDVQKKHILWQLTKYMGVDDITFEVSEDFYADLSVDVMIKKMWRVTGLTAALFVLLMWDHDREYHNRGYIDPKYIKYPYADSFTEQSNYIKTHRFWDYAEFVDSIRERILSKALPFSVDMIDSTYFGEPAEGGKFFIRHKGNRFAGDYFTQTEINALLMRFQELLDIFRLSCQQKLASKVCSPD